MRLSHVITFTTTLLSSLTNAEQPSSDKFTTYHNTQLSSLSGNPVKLTDETYAQLTATPRDYSAAILLTALEPKYQCGICREFQPEFELLSKTWTKGDKDGESGLVFGVLDVREGQRVFQALQLQTAPILLLFHPTTGLHARADAMPARFDFTTGINTAEPIHAWLSRQLPSRPHPPLVRPFDIFKIASVTTAVLGLITLVTVAAPYILPIIQNRNLWAAVSIIAILLFTSGHMFNHIRKVPYVAGNGKGGISYFAPGFQNQFGMETQIVAAMYGLLSFATISLALKVPRMSDARAQSIAVFVWGGVILGMYSFLLSVFRVKNGGYPFWLPPF